MVISLLNTWPQRQLVFCEVAICIKFVPSFYYYFFYYYSFQVNYFCIFVID